MGGMLTKIGVSADRRHSGTSDTSWKLSLKFFFSSLCLAVASYAGSNCSNLGQLVWNQPLHTINFYAAYGIEHGTFSFRRRDMACLDGFIGGPVWVFGDNTNTEQAKLSTSIAQFADLWGPLYAVPAAEGFENLLAIQSEGGIMFRISRPLLSPAEQIEDEVPLHWINASPIREQRKTPGNILHRLMTTSKGQERLPEQFSSFPAQGRFLIGRPGSSTSPVTVTDSLQSRQLLNLTPRAAAEMSPNAHCNLNLLEFTQRNTFSLHPVGTHQAYYLPEEYQLNFSGGQYINVGLQKVWKKRPAVTFKTRILEYCSKPPANAARIRQILQLRGGAEMSACTFNARRTSLEEALKLAYPEKLQDVEKACIAGDQAAISMYLGDLEATGIGHDDRSLLFWPFSTGVGEVFQLFEPPNWFEILRDTPDSACFATLSARCLPYAAYDRQQLVGRLCCNVSGTPATPALRTIVDLIPDGELRPPLKRDSVVKLGCGQLKIRDGGAPAQLTFYESSKRFHVWGRARSRGDNFHREQLVPSRPSPYAVEVFMHDRP